MKVAVMQPYLFPYIGYFQMIKEVDTFVIFDDVNFIKKGWINRNNILLNGIKHAWTLPLINASQNRLIKEIDIFEPGKNKQKLLTLFEQAYNKTPIYDNVFPMIKDIILNPDDSIVDFIENSLKIIANYLNLNTNFIRSSGISNLNSLRAQERIIDIVKRIGGTTYINAIGGMELYQKEAFKNADLEINFIKTGTVYYKHAADVFIPGLSIIDLIFNCDKDIVIKKLDNYELI